jgi:subtilisin family serine protease
MPGIETVTLGHLLASAPVVGLMLLFLYYQRKQQETTDKRRDELIDKWWDRHETNEKHQFETIDKLAGAIDKNSDMTTKLVSAIDSLSMNVRAQTPAFNSLTHEIHAMSHDGNDNEFHIGLPPGQQFPSMVTDRDHEAFSDTLPWTHQEFGIEKLYADGIRGKGAVVVVIDTGTDENHFDLKTNYVGTLSRSFTGEPISDGNGHGCHVGGIVCADDNGSGVRGVAPDANVIALKGLSNQGSGRSSWLAACIRYAADLPGHKIVNMSFGSSGEDPAITAAIKYAAQPSKNCWLVAAAGNAGPNSRNWPGYLPEVICVASTDKGGRVSSYSSANDEVDVGFGGRDILSTYPNNKLATLSGTSMATPGVAGVLALAVGELRKANKPIPSQKDMTDVLYATCKPQGGRNIFTGYGLVQPAEFLEKLVGATAPPVPPKPPVDPDMPVRIAVPDGAKFVVVDFAK